MYYFKLRLVRGGGDFFFKLYSFSVPQSFYLVMIANYCNPFARRLRKNVCFSFLPHQSGMCKLIARVAMRNSIREFEQSAESCRSFGSRGACWIWLIKQCLLQHPDNTHLMNGLPFPKRSSGVDHRCGISLTSCSQTAWPFSATEYQEWNIKC